MKEYTVREWVEKYNRKEFEKSDHETQCQAGLDVLEKLAEEFQKGEK